MKPLIVIGTRPESIKLAPLILELQSRGIEPVVCCTGQHHEMVTEVLSGFGILPTYMLCCESLAESIAAIDNVINRTDPVCAIVQGDTNSAAAGALAAFGRRVSVAHVEAGLRTYDLESPRPEEFNRRAITLAADWHFAPTADAQHSLRKEGVSMEKIRVVGNTGIDALLSSVPDVEPNGSVLVTSHRRENHGEGLLRICRAITALAVRHPENVFHWPIHPNPSVRDIVRDNVRGRNVHLTDPLSYRETVHLLSRCSAILTDSGGLCEEAVTLGIPTVILRETTERPEAVEQGLATLAGTKCESITRAGAAAIASPRQPRSTIYGDGKASRRIVDCLLSDNLRIGDAIPVDRPYPKQSPKQSLA
ncbi:UDP-N-acetylglucosamine 2-epimerase [Novipirellula galeiformis]|uniref:UDP-N-acetylglucosamine 2-epimerase (non-hydrolyzing) n=1 Tax=Novipirellula galeiformis TaxID=2528004 RepID=A0A5C6CCC0_9BACT|nr:UDP-N-acetylglucosamine 2-epimerase (non-hydrolyzing) [Novipirellula galeiformis]TWU22443.1 UDP-N-acetylglucosamine 2-epimerase [Novipirellula galeiformis]